jgi:hypothetical protein
MQLPVDVISGVVRRRHGTPSVDSRSTTNNSSCLSSQDYNLSAVWRDSSKRDVRYEHFYVSRVFQPNGLLAHSMPSSSLGAFSSQPFIHVPLRPVHANRPPFAVRLVSSRGLRRGLSEPGFEACLGQPRVITRKERSLAHLNAVITRVRVVDNLARILPRG